MFVKLSLRLNIFVGASVHLQTSKTDISSYITIYHYFHVVKNFSNDRFKILSKAV